MCKKKYFFTFFEAKPAKKKRKTVVHCPEISRNFKMGRKWLLEWSVLKPIKTKNKDQYVLENRLLIIFANQLRMAL
ncbi:MAG: hypothetical protein C5B59_10670 [Bacteroidetes bacterium]|nr:MAG: hypothetical protein C5B59_10670 [Bacteroidota bacterium]